MNSIRQVNKSVPGGRQCRSGRICAFFAILLVSVLLAVPRPAVDGQGVESTAGFDPVDGSVSNTCSASTVRLSCAATMPAPMGAVMAKGFFALPADTETTDSELAMAKLANPLFFILFCLTLAYWRPSAARRLSVPLYLFHRSLLC